MSRLRGLRDEIDRLDAEIVERLARRRAVVAEVARFKHEQGMTPVDPAREGEMRRALVAQGQALGVPEALVAGVLEAILQDSRAVVQGGAAGS